MMFLGDENDLASFCNSSMEDIYMAQIGYNNQGMSSMPLVGKPG
jgi:hypothetical protein